RRHERHRPRRGRRGLALPPDLRRPLPDHLQVPPVLLAVRDRRDPRQGARAWLSPRRLAPPPLQPVESRGLRPRSMTHLLILFSPLTPLEHALRHVLDWLHLTVGFTWAWSIVALTVMVRMLLVPLTVKQIHSMQNLQRYAPQMKEIQKKYKN